MGNLRIDRYEISTETQPFIRSVVREHSRGIVGVRGKDSLDFLHRLSTNDILKLPSNHWCFSAVVNEKGRFFDLLKVLNLGNSLLLFSSRPGGVELKNWLERYHFSEEVEIIDLTEKHRTYVLVGEDVAQLRSHFFGRSAGKTYESDSVMICTEDGLVALHDLRWKAEYWEVCIHSDAMMRFPELLGESMINRTEHTGSLDALEMLRIESSVPAIGSELNEEVNPLEAGLNYAVSFAKGCYIGQEVIARIDTYNKLQKRLARFAILENEGQEPHPGKLLNDGGEVGWTTSHARSPVSGKEVALGYIRTSVTDESLLLLRPNGSQKARAVIQP